MALGLEVIEATAFRTISGPVPAWEPLLPPQLLHVPEELARAARSGPPDLSRGHRFGWLCHSR